MLYANRRYETCPTGVQFEGQAPISRVDLVDKAMQNSTFSEYGHVLYHTKGNGVYNNMLANSLPLHTLSP